MTKEELDVIERSIALVIMCSSAVAVIIKVLEWLKARDKEKSVGATKIAELMDVDKKFQKDLEDLQKSDTKQNENIMDLKADHKQIMSLVLDWFKGKN